MRVLWLLKNTTRRYKIAVLTDSVATGGVDETPPVHDRIDGVKTPEGEKRHGREERLKGVTPGCIQLSQRG